MVLSTNVAVVVMVADEIAIAIVIVVTAAVICLRSLYFVGSQSPGKSECARPCARKWLASAFL